MPLNVDGRPLAGALLALFGLINATGQAQDMDWAKLHAYSNRYEGLVDRPDALRSYEILGFFGFNDASHVSSDGQLHILYYLPQNASVATFAVKERRSETQYLMMPIIGKLDPQAGEWHTFQDWPLRDVLIPSHVQLSNLDILIRLKSAVPDMYAPAFFYSLSRPGAVKEYAIDFVSHRQVGRYQCVVLDSTGKALGRNTCHAAGNPLVLEASRPVQFEIDPSALPQGLIAVRISGEYSNDESGDRLNAELHFINERLGELTGK